VNGTICIDASVAAKWVLAEDDSELANSLLDQAMRDRTRLAAPPHFVAEVTSAVYRRLRLGYLVREEAIEGVRKFANLPFDLMKHVRCNVRRTRIIASPLTKRTSRFRPI